MTTHEFRLPDVGEGLEEAEIVTWHVAAGDAVTHNQVLVEIETAKSLVELPSPFEGTVTALLVQEGRTVPVGTPIIAIGSAADPVPPVLVGYGPTEAGATRRRRKAAPSTGDDASAAAGATAVPTRAKPPVRKLARDLGVDLSAVPPSGPNGTVTRDDVVRFAEPGACAAERPVEAPATRVAVTGVRRATAAAVVGSAFTAPHVTEFVTVDVTRSVKLVEKLRSERALEGSRVTMLLLVARALLAAVRQFPDVNASWDQQAGEIVLHPRVNLGIAAATPRGLIVPNIKDAGALSLPGLAAALTDLVATAREGRSTPEDMSRGTITITNIGVFGVDTGTPILNPGEAAILCVGAVRRRPWEHRGGIALRWTTQLALSFDHRLVDGELGSRVLARVGKILEDPKWELLLS